VTKYMGDVQSYKVRHRPIEMGRITDSRLESDCGFHPGQDPALMRDDLAIIAQVVVRHAYLPS
jgi:hypothetical protein